jgi:hypothetical protein
MALSLTTPPLIHGTIRVLRNVNHRNDPRFEYLDSSSQKLFRISKNKGLKEVLQIGRNLIEFSTPLYTIR